MCRRWKLKLWEDVKSTSRQECERGCLGSLHGDHPRENGPRCTVSARANARTSCDLTGTGKSITIKPTFSSHCPVSLQISQASIEKVSHGTGRFYCCFRLLSCCCHRLDCGKLGHTALQVRISEIRTCRTYSHSIGTFECTFLFQMQERLFSSSCTDFACK